MYEYKIPGQHKTYLLALEMQIFPFHGSSFPIFLWRQQLLTFLVETN